MKRRAFARKIYAADVSCSTEQAAVSAAVSKTRKRSQAAASPAGEGPSNSERPTKKRVRIPTWLYLAFAAALVLALASRLPSLRAPVALDDFYQRAMIEGKLTIHRAAWNLYDFVDNDNHAGLVDRGIIPWWQDTTGYKARFLRPIPSLLVWIDFKLSGYDGFFPHLHSIVWWGIAVFGAHALFRRLFGARAALFCAATFAISPGHTVPIFWLANRNVLVTTAIGLWALSWYQRWRNELRPREGWISAALWLATMLTGEYALCFAGYIVSIELFRRGESIAQRFRATLPFVAPLVLYLALRVAFGYDVRQSTFYKNPLEDPIAYVLGAPRALAVLLGSAWFGFDDQTLASTSAPLMALAVVVLALIVVAALYNTTRSLSEEKAQSIGWLFVGSFIALLPVLSPRASMRLLGPAVIGVSGCVGMLMNATLGARAAKAKPKHGASPGVLGWLVAAGLAYAHFVNVPLSAYNFTKQAALAEPEFDQRLDWVRQHITPGVSTVLVLRGTTPPTAIVAPFMLRELAPARWRVLTQAYGQVVLVRSGPKTLEVSQDGNEPLIHFGEGDVVRALPLKVGETINAPGIRATIVALDEEQLPKQLHFEFDRDLDDPSFWSITEGRGGFREIKLPAVGFGVRLPP